MAKRHWVSRLATRAWFVLTATAAVLVGHALALPLSRSPLLWVLVGGLCWAEFWSIGIIDRWSVRLVSRQAEATR